MRAGRYPPTSIVAVVPMSSTPLFTVFTATYNRADRLHRVYDSLAAQTSDDFEWLIVDDGSTDGTGELVEGWTREASFAIRYVWQENAGKHSAWNRGVEEARGELFLSLDSDDECVPTAIERFRAAWDSISDAERPTFTGVSALCVTQHGRLEGTEYPTSPCDSDPLEIRYRHKVTGEKWGFHRIDVLRDHPFPVTPGRRFVSESLVWDRIAAHYRTRYVNERLRIYHVDYDEHSLMTQLRDPGEHSAMFLEVFAEQLNAHLRYARWAPLEFVRAGLLYVRHSLHQRRGPVRQLRGLRPAAWPFWVAGVPGGAALFVRDRARRRNAPSPV